MAASPYTWKTTEELNKKNQAATANTMAKSMAGGAVPAFGAAPAAPGAMPAPIPGGPAPSAGVTAFAMPKTTAEAMRQPTLESNMDLAQKNIEAGFGPLPTGPTDALARNQLQKTIDAGTRKVSELSTLAGRGATHQSEGDLVNFYQQSVIPQKAELEGNLQANRMKEEASRSATAQAQLQGLASLQTQKDLGLANIASAEGMQGKSIASAEGMQEKEIASAEGMQGKSIASAEGMQEKSIKSTEKISFAQLSQSEKEMALKASQFTDQLSWDKEATRLGLDEKAAERIWQGSENQKERDARATDSNLNRELQKYLGDRGLDMDEQKLAETIRQFDNKQDFDKWATQSGLDANAAELVWKSNEADVARKWETVERMSTEDHQVNLTRLQGEIDNGKAEFAQKLGIQTMEKQAEIDKITAATANEYQTARDTSMMSHDQAMEVLKSSLTAQLEQAGYDHQTALQAAEIQASAFQKDQDRKTESDMAKAELAYKHEALASQIGISKEEIESKKTEIANQLKLGLDQLGLDSKKIDAAIQSQDFQDRAGTLSTFLEMSGDNRDSVDRAAIGFLGLLKDQGLMTPEDYAAGVQGIKDAPQKEADAKAAEAATKKAQTMAALQAMRATNVSGGRVLR